MTYPPQQPDPYGRQPRSGGFPAQQPGPYGQPGAYGQPGGYGRPDPYGQQPGGYGQQPGYPGGDYPGGPPGGMGGPGFPGGEPPKKRTGLIAGIVAAVLLIAGAVAFTGFVEPGFFVSDNKDNQSGGQQTAQPTQPPETAGSLPTVPDGQTDSPSGDQGADAAQIEQIADTVVDGLNKKDAEIVKPVSCNPDLEKQEQYDGFPEGITWTVDGSASVTGQSATIPIKAAGPGGERTSTLNLKKADGKWCAANVG